MHLCAWPPPNTRKNFSSAPLMKVREPVVAVVAVVAEEAAAAPSQWLWSASVVLASGGGGRAARHVRLWPWCRGAGWQLKLQL